MTRCFFFFLAPAVLLAAAAGGRFSGAPAPLAPGSLKVGRLEVDRIVLKESLVLEAGKGTKVSIHKGGGEHVFVEVRNRHGQSVCLEACSTGCYLAVRDDPGKTPLALQPFSNGFYLQ